MTQVCARCGTVAEDEDRYCSSCGAPFRVDTGLRSVSSAEVTGTIHALGMVPADSGPLPALGPEALLGLPSDASVLIVVRGPNAGTRIDLTGDKVTAGRSPDAQIFLDDITVSRFHAQFTAEAEGWVLTDLGSLNGTYVNRDRVDRWVLRPGDEVQVGKYRFQFVSGSGAAPQEAS